MKPATQNENQRSRAKTLSWTNEDPSSNWSYSIKNCITQRKPKSAILMYVQNRSNGRITVSAVPLVLKACASLSLLSLGKTLHSESLKCGFDFNVMVGTSLVDMYGKCGDVLSSRKVFDEIPVRNVVTWNAMISGHMRSGDTMSAMKLFERMKDKTVVTWNEMVDGFARNGDLKMARRVFETVPKELKNVVTWTVMVDGYVSHGDMDGAGEVFESMRERNFYIWSVMIRGYFKMGDIVKARQVFDGMSSRNLVHWNTLISGYAQNGMVDEALNAFTRMIGEGFEPDEVTVTSVLSACAQSGMLDAGKRVHELILEKRIDLNEFVQNGLLDMYAKCGDLGNAMQIFEGLLVKNTTTWNSLITGLAIHGRCREAIDFFARMEKSNVQPDAITFLSVLSACAHGNFVEEGLSTSAKMKNYGIKLNIKHYGCLVDLLGRAGKLQEALSLVQGMPMAPNDVILGTLLGSCRNHSDTHMTEEVLELISKLSCSQDFHDDAHYVLLSNIYAASEKWETAENMRVAFSATGSEKITGRSAVMF